MTEISDRELFEAFGLGDIDTSDPLITLKALAAHAMKLEELNESVVSIARDVKYIAVMTTICAAVSIVILGFVLNFLFMPLSFGL